MGHAALDWVLERGSRGCVGNTRGITSAVREHMVDSLAPSLLVVVIKAVLGDVLHLFLHAMQSG